MLEMTRNASDKFSLRVNIMTSNHIDNTITHKMEPKIVRRVARPNRQNKLGRNMSFAARSDFNRCNVLFSLVKKWAVLITQELLL